MATKKSAPKSVVPAAGRAVAVVGSWRERAAASVSRTRETMAKLPANTGSFLSFRGGTISHGGVTLANPLPVVILAADFERSYYATQYQPDSGATPECYSYDGIAPHEKAATPQADACAQCRFNEFGSAINGKGKACKEGGKIALLHADALKSPELVAAAPIVLGRVSVLNAKTLRSFIDALGDEPLWADITMLGNRPDPKSQYAITLSRQNVAIEDEVLDAVSAREEEAIKLLATPYPEREDKPAPRAAAPARKSRFQR